MDNLTETITDQIGSFALMMIGASTPEPTTNADGITFTAHMIGTNDDGTRASRPRYMTVTIVLDINDTYIVEITHPGDHGPVTHFRATEVYAHQLEDLLIGVERGTLTGNHGARPTLR